MAVFVFDGRTAYDGTPGNDSFYLAAASVPLSVDADAGDDDVGGGMSADTLLGGTGDDTLYGGTDGPLGRSGGDDAADLLLGGAGDDVLILKDRFFDRGEGGAGNDVYVLTAYKAPDLPSSQPFERPGEGTDTVIVSDGGRLTATGTAAGFYALPDDVENLILTDDFTNSSLRFYSGPSTGLGNAADNTVAGNGSSNSLGGLDGNDVLLGGGGHDVLSGDAGNDTLIGEAGADTMYGGRGDDFYSVDDAGDVVREEADGGYDVVYASVSYFLDGAEVLFLTGTAVYGIGGAGGDALIGNDVANVLDAGGGATDFLNGLGGDDVLIGGPGHDGMMGGPGADLFRYDTLFDAGPGDFIYDFTAGEDRIQLNAAAFGMDVAGDGVNVVAGVTPAPLAALPTILYDVLTGFLFFDADGSDGAVPILLALLNGAPPLGAADIALL